MKQFFTLVVAATTFFALGGAAHAQIDPNRTVVIVNGEEIKGSEYYHRMEYLPRVGRQTGRSFSEFPPGLLTIDQLVTERLVLQLARKKGVFPTDAEVTAEYQARKLETPNMDELWVSSGRNLDELRAMIVLDVCQFNIETFGITITNQELDDYYTKHPDEFTVPKKYQLRVIVAKSDADRQSAEAALVAGKPFADVARQYSADVTKANGGEYGAVPETLLSQKVRTVLASTKLGSTSEWITSTPQSGDPSFVKFLIEKIEAPTKLELNDRLRRQIRRNLMLQEGRVKNDIKKEMKSFRSEAKVDVKQAEFKDAYDKFIQAYLKEGG